MNFGNYVHGESSGANLSVLLYRGISYYGQQKGNEFNGLGVKKYTKLNKTYVGQEVDSFDKGIGKCYYHDAK